MTNIHGIQAFVFDMDGLLFDSEQLSLRCWRKALREFDLELRDDVLPRFLGLDLHRRRAVLEETFGPSFSFEQALSLRMKIGDDEEAHHGIPLKPGVHEILQFAAEIEIPSAIATGTDVQRARSRLKRAGIENHFSVVVSSLDVAKGKPAPDIFLKAMAQLGKSPEVCLALEDSAPGIQSALAAGMRVIGIPDILPIAPELNVQAWRMCKNLSEAAHFLKSSMATRAGS